DLGRYELEAALQSAHAHRCMTGRNTLPDIVALYDALQLLTHSSIVSINRALAIAEVDGPEAGLLALPDPGNDQRLATYQSYWAARADLLARADRPTEASHAYDMAIGLERDGAVRAFLQKRKAQLTI
ncbi:MAG: hypothetical protein QM773_21350, partial [Hyphomonadaceae bacterium]